MSKTSKHYLNTAIGLAIMLFFKFVPPLEGITPLGMNILGIFIGMLWLWITVDSLWSSALALLLIAFSGYLEATGYAAVTTVFSAAFGNSTVLLILFYMILFGPIGEIGLSEKFATFLLKQKFLEGKPYLLIFMITLCSYLLGGFGDVLVCLFIMWPIVEEISRKCNAGEGSKFRYTLVGSVFLGAVTGQPLLPFKGLVAGLLATYAQIFPDAPLDMGIYIPFNVIMAVILIIGYVLLVRFWIKPDVTALKSLKREDIISGSNEKMTPVQLLYSFMLIVMILSVVLPSISPAFSFLSRLGVLGIVTLLMSLAMILRDKEGKPIVEIAKLAKKNVNWNMLFSVSTAIYIANVLVADATGIKATLSHVLEPLLSGMPTAIFIVIVVAAGLLVTNLTNNMVIGIILITLLGVFASAMPALNTSAASVMVILTVCQAFLLPSGSIYSSVLHARRDLISFNEIYKVFVPTSILVLVIYSVIGYPLAVMMFS